MNDIIINQLPSDVQNYIRAQQIDVGNDGHINGNDVEAIRDALSREGSPNSKHLLEGLLNAVNNPLVTPRSDAAGVRLGDASSTRKSSTPAALVDTLSQDDFRGATVDERIKMIGYTMRGEGYWFPKVRHLFDAKREREVLDIIWNAPDYQKPALAEKLHSSGLSAELLSRVSDDPAQANRLKSFLQRYVWAVGSPNDVADAVKSIGLHNEGQLVALLGEVRSHRGDAFADQMLGAMIGSGTLRDAVPYLYFRAPYWSCNDVSDVARAENRRGMLTNQRNIDGAALERLLPSLPPGHSRDLLVNEFEQHHNIERDMAGVSAGACTVKLATEAALAIAAQAAAERQEREDRYERNRQREQRGSGTGLDTRSGTGLDNPTPTTRSRSTTGLPTTTTEPTPAPEKPRFNPIAPLPGGRTSTGLGGGMNRGGGDADTRSAPVATQAAKPTLGSGMNRGTGSSGTSAAPTPSAAKPAAPKLGSGLNRK